MRFRLFVLVGLIVGTVIPARAEVSDWKAREAAFWAEWIVDVEVPRARQGKLRARKRKAAKALQVVADARAVQVLRKAQEEQQELVAALHTAWAKRRAAWKKLEAGMRKSLDAKALAGGKPDYPKSAEEKAWLEEELALEGLYRDVLKEAEIAEYARSSAASVLGRLEGKERKVAIRTLLAAIGRGETPEARDFVRILGQTSGEDVTQSLLALAQQPKAPLAQVALEALGRQNAPGNVDLLTGFLEDPRWQIRAAAIGALGYFKQVRVVDLLIERAQQEPGVLQRHCFTALSDILGEVVPGGVDAWKVWWTKNQARFAAEWKNETGGEPIRTPSQRVMVRQGQGHTTFYGIQTNSKHIVFLIDRSGSMSAADESGAGKGKRRIDVAKEELKRAIRSLSTEDQDERGEATFNIVAYAAMVTVYKSGKMVRATKANKEDAFAWIDRLQPGGATNIFDALEMGFQIISVKKDRLNLLKGADTFFLMTDGHPTTGRVRTPDLILEEVRKLNATRQVIIHTIGVGTDHKERFLSQLAAENRGEYLGR